jgi:hypothetical protein
MGDLSVRPFSDNPEARLLAERAFFILLVARQSSLLSSGQHRTGELIAKFENFSLLRQSTRSCQRLEYRRTIVQMLNFLGEDPGNRLLFRIARQAGDLALACLAAEAVNAVLAIAKAWLPSYQCSQGRMGDEEAFVYFSPLTEAITVSQQQVAAVAKPAGWVEIPESELQSVMGEVGLDVGDKASESAELIRNQLGTTLGLERASHFLIEILVEVVPAIQERRWLGFSAQRFSTFQGVLERANALLGAAQSMGEPLTMLQGIVKAQGYDDLAATLARLS